MANAEVPAPAVFGVERVVVACEISGTFSESERHGICEQLIRRAKQATDLPVAEAKPADLTPLSAKPKKHELILQVHASARDIEPGRKGLEVSVTPVRPMVAVGQLPALKSTASLMQVRGNWLVQGPIDAFDKVLGSTRGRGLRAPLTSDRS